jgi:hypothetical protein
MPSQTERTRSNFIVEGAAALLALAGISMFMTRAYQGLWFEGYPDETTHLLGARMLNAGGVLYRDFVDNHGPVIYLLASTYGKLAGWSSPNFARLIPFLLMVLAGGAIAISPALSTRSARLCAIGLFLGSISSVWVVQGLHLVSFYPVAGAFAAIVIALFVAPAWFGRPIPPAFATAAGFAAGLLCFTGYQYLPTVLMFATAGLGVCWSRGWNRSSAMFVIGGLLASALVLIWLTINGDFVGFLAFHIALGQTAFRPFIELGLHQFYWSLNPSVDPQYLVQTLATVGFTLSGLLLLVLIMSPVRSHTLIRACACSLGLIGVLLLNARGARTFKDGSFVVGVSALFAIVLPAVCYEMSRLRLAIKASLPFIAATFLAAIELTARHASTTPLAVNRDMAGILIAQRVSSPLTDRIRAILGPEDRFLALVYQPDLYWAADRLPIPGFFAYLPWDAAYARSPWFNRPHDLCVSLSETPPKLIVFDDWKVWDRYMPRDYMPCLLDILAEHYRLNPDVPTLYEYHGDGLQRANANHNP